jgi:hypothetical protein
VLLWGCGDKLTEETARQVIEKEILPERNSGGLTQMVFTEGSDGFNYFQKMITDGSFQFEKEEDASFEVLLRNKPKVKVYSPKSELANVFRELRIKVVVDNDKFDIKDILSLEKKKLPRKTVCEVSANIKKYTLKSIDEILNDENKGTAVVKFTIEQVGIAPYYAELCSLMYPGKPEGTGRCELRKPYSIEVQLKKYDEGWDIDKNPN